jgi:hypothetical protein
MKRIPHKVKKMIMKGRPAKPAQEIASDIAKKFREKNSGKRPV